MQNRLEAHPKARAIMALRPKMARRSRLYRAGSVCISEDARPGAFRFLNQLFYALESRKHGTQPIEDDSHSIQLIVHGEPVSVELYEPHRWDKNRETRTVLFEVVDCIEPHRLQRKWIDRDFDCLAKKLPTIVHGLELVSPYVREVRTEALRRYAARVAEERIRNAKKKRVEQLQKDLTAWQKEMALRNLIDHVANIAERTEEANEQLALWVQWATAMASKAGPLGDGIGPFLHRYDLDLLTATNETDEAQGTE